MLKMIFDVATKTVSLYSTLCIIRIFLTWFPQLNYSKPGQILGAICDPYLNIFRKIPLKIGMLDFSPLLAIGLLSLISSILTGISNTGRLSLSMILAIILRMAWSIFSSFATIFLIMLIIRLLVMLFSKKTEYYDSPWTNFDNALTPFIYKLIRPFSGGKIISYKGALGIAIFETILILVAGNILIFYGLVGISFIPV